MGRMCLEKNYLISSELALEQVACGQLINFSSSVGVSWPLRHQAVLCFPGIFAGTDQSLTLPLTEIPRTT